MHKEIAVMVLQKNNIQTERNQLIGHVGRTYLVPGILNRTSVASVITTDDLLCLHIVLVYLDIRLIGFKFCSLAN